MTDPNSELYEQVKDVIVEVLAVEPDEVIPTARFFDDLGGESLDVIDMSFHCERRFGTRFRFQELVDSKESEVSAESIDRSLFTIDAIVQFVEAKLAESAAAQSEIQVVNT